MLPLSVFRNRSFTRRVWHYATVFALAGSLFFLSQYYQTVRGLRYLHGGRRSAASGAILLHYVRS